METLEKNIQKIDKEINTKIILRALEHAMLILGAFIFYALMRDYKKDILEYIPFAKKHYSIITLILHLLFIFGLDLLLLYIFAIVFGIPI